MTTIEATVIKATVRDGRLEVEHPIDLPNGTEILIPVPKHEIEDYWDNSPEGIAKWLEWFDSLPTLSTTPDEEADAEAWLKKMNDVGRREIERVRGTSR